MDHDIGVFADWNVTTAPNKIGTLRARSGRAGQVFEFSFDDEALATNIIPMTMLDPDLRVFAGRQYPGAGRTRFGIFSDSSPDRFGRKLIERRFERDRRAGRVASNARLVESDYLLGVHDAFRSGALRFRTSPDGPFLDDRNDRAAPPFVRLRELEAISRAIESDTNNDAPEGEAWLRMLIAPGASLGGARPKSAAVDPSGADWIAKFPSIRDDLDVGAWECVVARLAARCGLHVPESTARTFASDRHTFLVRRFDRSSRGDRIHFASAMTLTGRTDGDDASSGASYLEIAEIIATHGASPRADLLELWSRIVFNILVSNTDDHLRNHGFLLDPHAGWRLSPAYDVNPIPGSRALSLNVDEIDNARDLDLARSVARYFRVDDASSREIIDRFTTIVAGWIDIASDLSISKRERTVMADAFASL